jgi:hypothetical protein
MPLDVGKFAPVTLGHMRSQGCRELLAYCNSGRWNHNTTMNVGHLPDNTPIKSLADSIICTECGHVGADMTSQTGGPHYGILNAEFQKLALRFRTVATAFMSSTGADGIRGMSAPAAWLRGRYSEANQLYELVSNSPGFFFRTPLLRVWQAQFTACSGLHRHNF